MNKREWINEVYDVPIEERGVTDYLFLLSKGVTKEEREKLDVGNLFINGAVCLHCKSFIRSMNRRHLKHCPCGKVAVDGGSWYARRVGEPGDYINVIEEFTK